MKVLFMALEDFRSRDAGSRIRDWYVVQGLASLGEVTVLCFSPGHTTEARFDIPGVEFLIDDPISEKAALIRAGMRGTMYHVERYDFSRHKDVEAVRDQDFDLAVSSQLYPMAHLEAVVGPVDSRPPVLWDTHNFDPDVWNVKTEIGALPQRAFAMLSQPRAAKLIAQATDTADVIVACTPADGEAWEAISGGTPVAVVPNAADLDGWERSRSTRGGEYTFVLFGSLNQESTHAGAMWFLDNVWPTYAATRPEASLIVAGRNPDQELVAAAPPGSQVEVVANPLDLVPVVARAGTVVVPQVWGTGSKLKMAEALASGRRIVASPVAAVGIPEVLAGYVGNAESVEEWHKLMDAASATPRSEEEVEQLVELLSSAMSWTTSQRQLIEAVETVIS